MHLRELYFENSGISYLLIRIPGMCNSTKSSGMNAREVTILRLCCAEQRSRSVTIRRKQQRRGTGEMALNKNLYFSKERMKSQ
jgi:hypothetical protein